MQGLVLLGGRCGLECYRDNTTKHYIYLVFFISAWVTDSRNPHKNEYLTLALFLRTIFRFLQATRLIADGRVTIGLDITQFERRKQHEK
jgi:hypothetical protein